MNQWRFWTGNHENNNMTQIFNFTPIEPEKYYTIFTARVEHISKDILADSTMIPFLPVWHNHVGLAVPYENHKDFFKKHRGIVGVRVQKFYNIHTDEHTYNDQCHYDVAELVIKYEELLPDLHASLKKLDMDYNLSFAAYQPEKNKTKRLFRIGDLEADPEKTELQVQTTNKLINEFNSRLEDGTFLQDQPILKLNIQLGRNYDTDVRASILSMIGETFTDTVITSYSQNTMVITKNFEDINNLLDMMTLVGASEKINVFVQIPHNIGTYLDDELVMKYAIKEIKKNKE